MANRYAKAPSETDGQFHTMQRNTRPLYPALDRQFGALVTLCKSLNPEATTSVAMGSGEILPQFDYAAATKFKVHNTHHSTCIEAKRQATVGLGHVSPETSKVLNKLCRPTWQGVISQVAEEYYNLGTGFLEVVRNADGEIRGLHFLPARKVRIKLEDDFGRNRHFVANGIGTLGGSNANVQLAEFGDLEDFRARHSIPDGRRISEVIHFPMMSSLDQIYGFPDWLAATAPIELVQALHQHQFDFHSNHGVPEFLLFMLKAKVDPKTWRDMKSTFDNYVGVGNQHKSSMFNLSDPNLEVQLERLSNEVVANGTFFRDMSEALATMIVSGHRVPPPLAGILIPGKMGAANEGSNAVIMFQSLVVGPNQTHFEEILGSTLGDSAVASGLGLNGKEAFELKTVVDEMAEATKKLQPIDTMQRMRDELPDAAAEGRDLEDGLQKSEMGEIIRGILKGL